MISKKLIQTFNFLEMAMFPRWQKANKKERDRICRKLGKLEAIMFIKEVKKHGIKTSKKEKSYYI